MSQELNLDKKLIVIFGPTASGKTDLSIKIAKFIWGRFRIESEFISADSREFYRGMYAGSNKMDFEKRKKFKIHLVDILSPDEQFDEQQYKRQAEDIISQIHKKGRLPIMVGGTGTLIMSVVGGRYLIAPRSSGEKVISDSILLIPAFNRKTLYRKIERNVDRMFKQGLYGEIKDLVTNSKEVPRQLKRTLGYREFFEYCVRYKRDIFSLSKIDLSKIRWKIKANTKKYAMHQAGWLKKLKGVIFVEDFAKAKKLLVDFITRG